MSSHHLRDGVKRTSDGNTRRRLWRVPTRRRAMEGNGPAGRVANMQARRCGEGKVGSHFLRGATTLVKQEGPSVTSSLRRVVSCGGAGGGARAAKFAKKLGEPCGGQPRTQECAKCFCCLEPSARTSTSRAGSISCRLTLL